MPVYNIPLHITYEDVPKEACLSNEVPLNPKKSQEKSTYMHGGYKLFKSTISNEQRFVSFSVKFIAIKPS